MAITKKLKALINHATQVVSFFEEIHSSIYTIIPYVDLSEVDTETVTITFNHDLEDGLSWQFLEPVSTYCVQKNIAWKIFVQDNKFSIELRY